MSWLMIWQNLLSSGVRLLGPSICFRKTKVRRLGVEVSAEKGRGRRASSCKVH